MVDRLKHGERRLLYIPILHNIFDKVECRGMQGLEGIQVAWGIASEYPEMIRQYQEGLERYWEGVEKFLAEHKIDKVYQDGYCEVSYNELMKSLKEVLKTSRNWRAVYDLKQRGAKLVVTESRKTLLKQIQTQISANDERDRYAAARINNTLRDRETGVLFMGLRHRTDQVLKTGYPSIEVQRYVGNFDDLLSIFKMYYEIVINRTQSSRDSKLEDFLGEYGQRPFSDEQALDPTFLSQEVIVSPDSPQGSLIHLE